MTFGQAVSTCFSKYAKFSGRSPRSEYWWFYLFYLVSYLAALIVVAIFTAILGEVGATIGGGILVLWLLLLLLPTLAATVRRLHDTGRSGWWQLIAFTGIGVIPLLIWLASAGEPRDNAYGPALSSVQ